MFSFLIGHSSCRYRLLLLSLNTPVRKIDQLPVIGQTHTPRIEIPGVAQSPHLLRMRMPTREQRRLVATQVLPHHLIRRLWENDLIERTRRAMKTQQRLPALQHDLQPGLELLDE